MSQANILIVDDEEQICAVMEEALEDKGYQIFTANNGVAGLKVCAEEKIDLILLDLNMPRMDGYMFMEHLTDRWEKEGRRFSLPKVLVLTAVSSNTDMGLAKNLGAWQILGKPFKNIELVETVARMLS